MIAIGDIPRADPRELDRVITVRRSGIYLIAEAEGRPLVYQRIGAPGRNIRMRARHALRRLARRERGQAIQSRWIAARVNQIDQEASSCE